MKGRRFRLNSYGYDQRPPAVVALIGLMFLVLSACNLSSMQFTQDHRVRVVTPSPRSTVTLPVTLSWEVQGFEVIGKEPGSSPGQGYFAVFVDRTPVPPAKSLVWYANQRGTCGPDPCGDPARLSFVFETSETHLNLDRLPDLADDRSGVEHHEAVIVLMDGDGRRIGESAFYVRFSLDRRNG